MQSQDRYVERNKLEADSLTLAECGVNKDARLIVRIRPGYFVEYKHERIPVTEARTFFEVRDIIKKAKGIPMYGCFVVPHIHIVVSVCVYFSAVKVSDIN